MDVPIQIDGIYDLLYVPRGKFVKYVETLNQKWPPGRS